ncbi:hypothetical protein B0H34DRAFT_860619 [Crassisporium funariophilum]|nr:hypothetical protein B0H34DRAFT_860619 [Crassisporium funariophilum]
MATISTAGITPSITTAEIKDANIASEPPRRGEERNYRYYLNTLLKALPPPRLHFGWPYIEERFLEVGVRKDFVRTVMLGPGYPGGEDLMCADIRKTESRLREVVHHEMGISETICRPEMRRAYARTGCGFLGLTNNYDRGDYMPPPDVAERLRIFFEFDQPAQWYLDAEGDKFCWGYHSLVREW